MAKKYSMPENLKIPPLEVPTFEPRIREDQLEDLQQLSPPEKAILLNLSVIEQQTNFTIKTLVRGNGHMRQMETEQLSQGQVVQRMDNIFRVFRWVGIVLGSGAFLAAGKFLFAWFTR